jgi:hypothetical protein
MKCRYVGGKYMHFMTTNSELANGLRLSTEVPRQDLSGA